MTFDMHEERVADAARSYGRAIVVPPMNLAAIERRSAKSHDRRFDRFIIGGALAAGLLLWSAPALPALITNAIHVFLEQNGHLMPATNEQVTIEGAARLVPFAVIRPAGIPFDVPPAIQVIQLPGSSQSAQLLIQYPSALHGGKTGFTALPKFSIVETSASAPSASVFMAVRQGPAPKLAPLPKKGATGLYGRNGAGTVRIRLLSLTWVQQGTRVTISAVPGAMTMAQLESIRHAMGGP
jgi:hypothetical protein